MAPEWERLTAHIEADPVSKEKLGWVREMYAFSTAVALKKIKLDIVACPECPLISQVRLQIQFLTCELHQGDINLLAEELCADASCQKLTEHAPNAFLPCF